MSTTLDADGMRALVDAHSEGEQARNWPSVLATMVVEPYYEFYPYRLRISGDAILDMWTRIFAEEGTLRCFNIDHIDVDTVEFSESVGDDTLVHIMGATFFTEEGEPRRSSNVVRYRFDGDLMLSETLWVCSNLMRYLDAVFDESFRALPGVEDI